MADSNFIQMTLDEFCALPSMTPVELIDLFQARFRFKGFTFDDETVIEIRCERNVVNVSIYQDPPF